MSDTNKSVRSSIDAMLNPQSVAIIGATPRPLVYGGRFVRSALLAKDRLRIYPVNPRYDSLMDLPCYPSVKDLPEIPDAVGIVVPAEAVFGVLEECHEMGVRAAVIVSAGFSERDSAGGRDLQSRLGEFALATGLRILGPNCLGIGNVAEGIWLCAASTVPNGVVPRPGPIGLVSQSGATAFATLLVRAVDLGIGLSALVSTGNEADLDFTDFANYLLDDPATRVIAGYVEGFKDARKFLQFASRAAERNVPVVLTKTGRSAQGAAAARAHTASLTGSDAIYEGIFEQFGIIRTDDYEDLLQVANLMGHTKPRRRRGIGLMSHSGGMNAMTSDLLGSHGLELPALTDRTKAAIDAVLGGFGWGANPADLTGKMRSDAFGPILKQFCNEPEIGTVVIASSGRDDHVNTLVAERERSDTGIVYLWTATHEAPGLDQLRDASVPIFYTPSSLAAGLAARAKYFDWWERKEATGATDSLAPLTASERQVVERLRQTGRTKLSGAESEELLSAFAVPCAASRVALSPDEAASTAQEIGFPVVLKADSPDLPHKTEIGAVHLNLRSEEEVRIAYDEIVNAVSKSEPSADLRGVVVQQQIRGGVEAIIGVTYDPQAGPVLLFGIGGVTVELYQDVMFRSCPIDRSEAFEMTRSIKAAALLRGFRNSSLSDIDALADAIVAMSRLAVLLEGALTELEVNPLLVLPAPNGVRAVDALATLHSLEASR